jgi:sec-independent protein translocase protein TatA
MFNGSFGWGELLIILLIAVVLFGGKKIPELAQGLGKGIKEFKKALAGDENADKKSDSPKDPDNK